MKDDETYRKRRGIKKDPVPSQRDRASSSEDQSGLAKRIFDRIRFGFNLFEGEHKKKALEGRIYNLHLTITELSSELVEIKNQWEKEIDEELFYFVKGSLDPLIRECSRLKNVLNQSKTAFEQARAFREFSEWIEKAKIWVNLYKEAKSEEAIEQAVISHIVHESELLIDRDFQVILDYQDHLFASLQLPKEDERALFYHIFSRLCHDLSCLKRLKEEKPSTLDLTTIASWRRVIDKKRQGIFDSALHAIDDAAAPYLHEEASQEEQLHLVDVLHQITYLENMLPGLIHEIQTEDLTDDRVRNRLVGELEALEKEAHKLNLDLRLPPDCVERLQNVMNELFSAKILLP